MTEKPEQLKLYSIGEVAKKAGTSRDQAVYAARAYRIDPTVVAGNRRLYDEHAAERICSAIRRIQLSRCEDAGGVACPS